MIININTKVEIKELSDLKNLRVVLEANGVKKPNYSQIARQMGVDRRTVKKIYESNGVKPQRKKRISKIDAFEDIIRELLFPDGKEQMQIFFYVSHLYRFLVREYKLDVAFNTFNYYISNHKEFKGYFKEKKSTEAVKSEKPFGEQAQFDWKEKLEFTFKDGTKTVINVACLILAASRFKIWKVYLSTNQNCLFDFLSNAFETLGGVPRELIIDNASTMMDSARTLKSSGKINNKFQQLANDFNFEIKPCIAGRPNTKAKIESPMKLLDEIMTYNGRLDDFEALEKLVETLNNEANSRISQGTGHFPVLVLKKEKEHLLPLPSEQVCSSYKNKFFVAKVNKNSLLLHKGHQYSVPPEYIGKLVHILLAEEEIHIYYSKKIIAVHKISSKQINYIQKHHSKMIEKTFPKAQNIEELATEHLKNLEKYNEQISGITE